MSSVAVSPFDQVKAAAHRVVDAAADRKILSAGDLEAMTALESLARQTAELREEVLPGVMDFCMISRGSQTIALPNDRTASIPSIEFEPVRLRLDALGKAIIEAIDEADKQHVAALDARVKSDAALTDLLRRILAEDAEVRALAEIFLASSSRRDAALTEAWELEAGMRREGVTDEGQINAAREPHRLRAFEEDRSLPDLRDALVKRLLTAGASNELCARSTLLLTLARSRNIAVKDGRIAAIYRARLG